MKNNQLFPFERNRYYSGKLLTSADFEAEQLYMNNKRRFLNRIMFGSGIACGLSVVNLDDLSILMESGVAIDETGREIVVESTVIKRLSGVKGFDSLQGDRAGLYIRYREEDVHAVYCGDMGTDGKEYESNRIDESYELYLKDLEETAPFEDEGGELILRERFMDNADYEISVSVPYTVAKGQAVKLMVSVLRKSEESKTLYFHARLQMPAFTDPEGKHELEIDLCDISLSKGQRMTRDYWVNCDPTEAAETDILCSREDIRLRVDGYEVEPGGGIHFKVLLSDRQPYQIAASEAGKASLDANMRSKAEDGVCIAALQLLRTDVSCLISEIREEGFRHYIMTPGKADQRQLLMSYFAESDRKRRVPEPQRQETYRSVAAMETPAFMASGRLEIPLDVNMKKGDVCVSEEIMHGLGKGNVYVEVGKEYIDENMYGRKNSRNVIYGNPALFDVEECMQVETAVRVLNDRGSFQVAARLLGEQKSIVLQLGWVAFKFGPEKAVEELQDAEGFIAPEMPTVRLRAKESYFFNVSFHNMEPCRLSYELTEPESGEIGADGLYTAPAKEGVYEIYIYCTDMPGISTYAYAVVSK